MDLGPATLLADAPDSPTTPLIERNRIGEIIQNSEQVVHIMGMPPHWLARWGTTAMAAVVAGLAVLSWVIHFPDIVSAGVIVTTPVPPAVVVAQASGHLETLAVHDGDVVENGVILARIASSADPDAVARLQAVLAKWTDDQVPPEETMAAVAKLPLGELQADFAVFARAHAAYSWRIKADPAATQLRALAAQRAPLIDRAASIARQRVLLAREEIVAQRGYERASQLAQRQDASMLTVDDRERVVLAARRGLETLLVDDANTRLELDHVDQAIIEFGLREQQQRQELLMALREAVKTLSGRLAVWERTYVLRAPISGTISLSHFWTDSQFVKSGEEVLAIVPAEAQAPIGRIMLPVSRAGSVQIGQAIFVTLDNYPGERFGLLKGRVAAIAPVPLEARYAVTMTLPDGLVTTFNQKLAYQQEMRGQAEIVVEDLRVIDRIFYQLRHLFHSSLAKGA